MEDFEAFIDNSFVNVNFDFDISQHLSQPMKTSKDSWVCTFKDLWDCILVNLWDFNTGFRYKVTFKIKYK